MLLDGNHSVESHFNLVNHQLKQIRTALAIASLLNRTLVNVMLKELPVEEFGPQIGIREYSFLDNPSLPREVKESWLDVQLCQVVSKGCKVSNSTTRPGLLRVPRHVSDETLETVLRPFKDVKVIQFSSMEDAFTGFTDQAREQRFRKRVKQYLGIWCCVASHTPGHIYYDIYWDEKPGWKPAPPKTPQDDHPPH